MLVQLAASSGSLSGTARRLGMRSHRYLLAHMDNAADGSSTPFIVRGEFDFAHFCARTGHP